MIEFLILGSPTEKHYGAKLIKGKICTQTNIPEFLDNETNMELIIKPKFLTFSISEYKNYTITFCLYAWVGNSIF